MNYFFLHGNKKISDFDEYFQSKFLEDIYYKCMLLKGEDIPDYLDKLGKDKYKELSQYSSINICDFNQ